MARTLFALLLAACVASTAAVAGQAMPNFSGSWTGSMVIPVKGAREKTPLHAAFTQAGPELTGTIGPSADTQAPITNGRVEATQFGTVITFDMPAPSFVMHFELRPAEGFLRGVAKLDGEKATAPVELQAIK